MNHTLSRLSKYLPQHQCWWILEYITGKTKEQLIVQNYSFSQEDNKQLEDIIFRMQNHEPLAYILEKTEFLDLDLAIKPPILIPRTETEYFMHYCLEKLSGHAIKTFLDIGTGSGCIGLSLAQHFPQSNVTLCDISEKALHLAQENAKRNNLKNIKTIQSDVYESITQKYDCILSNPPYIPTTYTNKLEASVQNYEDHKALFAGKDGLEIISKIIVDAHKHLTDTDLPFKLALEVDTSHTKQVVQLCLENKFGQAWVLPDQYKRPRFVFAK